MNASDRTAEHALSNLRRREKSTGSSIAEDLRYRHQLREQADAARNARLRRHRQRRAAQIEPEDVA